MTIRPFIILSTERLARLAAGLFCTAIIARSLSVGEYGEWIVLLGIYAALQPLASLGMESLAIREFARSTTPNATLRTFGSIRIASGAAAILLFLCISSVALPSIPIFVVGIGSLVFILQAVDLLEYQMLSDDRFIRIATIKLCSTILSLAIKLFIILFVQSLSAVVCTLAIDAAILLVIHLLFAPRLISEIYHNKRKDANSAVQYIKESIPQTISAALVLIGLNADKFLVHSMMGSNSAGIYGAGTKLTEAAYFIPVVLGSMSIGGLTRNLNNETALRAMYVGLVRKTNLLVFAVVITTWISATLFITLIYGQRYLDAIPVAMAHILTLAGVSMTSVRTRLFVAHGLSHKVAIMSAITTCLVLVTSIIAIAATHSLIAVAVAQALSWGVGGFLLPMLPFMSIRYAKETITPKGNT